MQYELSDLIYETLILLDLQKGFYVKFYSSYTILFLLCREKISKILNKHFYYLEEFSLYFLR